MPTRATCPNLHVYIQEALAPSETNTMPLQPSSLHFYFSSSSVICARIRIAAHLKKIPLVPHPIKKTEDAYHASTSMHLNHRIIPTLTADYPNGQQLTLTQSLSMLEYFEEVYPGEQRLLPPVTDMRQRIMARDLANLIAGFDYGIRPSVPKGDTVHDIRQLLHISRCLEMYERLFKSSARRYSLGGQLSIADVCLIPLVQSGEHMGLQVGCWSSINRIVTECRKIDAFRDALLQA